MDGSVSAIYKARRTTRLARPLFGSELLAGSPSPAEDYVEERIDLNRDLLELRNADTDLGSKGYDNGRRAHRDGASRAELSPFGDMSSAKKVSHHLPVIPTRDRVFR